MLSKWREKSAYSLQFYPLFPLLVKIHIGLKMVWSSRLSAWLFRMSVSCPCGRTQAWNIAVFHVSHACLSLLTYLKLLTRARRKWRGPCSIPIGKLTPSWAKPLLWFHLKGKYFTVTGMTLSALSLSHPLLCRSDCPRVELIIQGSRKDWKHAVPLLVHVLFKNRD